MFFDKDALLDIIAIGFLNPEPTLADPTPGPV
jgi:hypothetical protein